jgi:hypothetical protein
VLSQTNFYQMLDFGSAQNYYVVRVKITPAEKIYRTLLLSPENVSEKCTADY